MKNADKPAFGNLEEHIYTDGVCSGISGGGLTKREHFAGLAMQGLITDGQVCRISEVFGSSARVIAEMSVILADALLEELEKTKHSK